MLGISSDTTQHVSKISDDFTSCGQKSKMFEGERCQEFKCSKKLQPVCLCVFMCVCVRRLATSHSHLQWELSRGNQTKQPRALSQQRAREVHRSERPYCCCCCCDRTRKKRERNTTLHNISGPCFHPAPLGEGPLNWKAGIAHCAW